MAGKYRLELEADSFPELVELIRSAAITAPAGLAAAAPSMPAANQWTPPRAPDAPAGRACPTHLKELGYKAPPAGANWPAGFYCPERGCRTYVPQ